MLRDRRYAPDVMLRSIRWEFDERDPVGYDLRLRLFATLRVPIAVGVLEADVIGELEALPTIFPGTLRGR